jgi:anthranilate phosphoribosyltransferase
VEKLAEALSILGTHRAFVVHGLDGLDEITITGPTRVAEVDRGQVRSYEITPEEFGVKPAAREEISGGNAKENARIVRQILEGERSPRRDVVLMNAAAALVAAGRSELLRAAMSVAAKSVDSGSAAQKLDALVRFTSLPGPTPH